MDMMKWEFIALSSELDSLSLAYLDNSKGRDDGVSFCNDYISEHIILLVTLFYYFE
jgi:hypothetical protein